ncbi:MAG: proline--tRNA ligase [Puniceicoccaceae bacterium]
MAKAPVLTPQADDFPRWYQDVLTKAELADHGPVRGTMVIRPYGYALWERMQAEVDARIKAAGAENAYFPLFIPESYLQREAEHVEGFSPELAVVTVGGGKELEEPVVVRPTSETVIGEYMSKWVQSHRDLPLLLNQWANVVRWEMRTRIFLRTAEFLWQEGHTVHATEAEAVEETLKMLDVYADFAENYMAMPVIKGEKTEGERFPGAVNTYSIEAMMQDGKALQAGTSHFLGQNFAKSCNIKFLSKEGVEEHAWTTSWGVSTRLIGGMIMTHADDDGMVMPPRLASQQIVIMPVIPKEEQRESVMAYVDALYAELKSKSYAGRPLRVKVDDRDLRGGEKAWQWVKKGVPVRIEVGPRDVESGKLVMIRRDQGPKAKEFLERDAFIAGVESLLQEIQDALLQRAKAYREARTCEVNSRAAYESYFASETDETGFAIAYWAGDAELEDALSKQFKTTVRCVLLDAFEPGECIFTGKPTTRKAVFAKAY